MKRVEEPVAVDRTDSLLLRAIARNAKIVLSLPAGRELSHHHSRFLSETPGGFWVAAGPETVPLLDPLIAGGRPVGVSFRDGAYNVMIAAPVLRQDLHRVNATTRVPALLLGFHPMSGALERRKVDRVRPAALADVAVRVWRTGEGARASDRPQRGDELSCEVADLSVDGMGLIVRGSPGQERAAVAPGQRLRIEIRHTGGQVCVAGHVRHVAEAGDPLAVRAGVRFAITDDAAGCEALAQLTRLVARVQRAAGPHTRKPSSRAA